jgi:hypothetical protein
MIGPTEIALDRVDGLLDPPGPKVADVVLRLPLAFPSAEKLKSFPLPTLLHRLILGIVDLSYSISGSGESA